MFHGGAQTGTQAKTSTTRVKARGENCNLSTLKQNRRVKHEEKKLPSLQPEQQHLKSESITHTGRPGRDQSLHLKRGHLSGFECRVERKGRAQIRNRAVRG